LLSGLKAFLEHNIASDLSADHAPDAIEKNWQASGKPAGQMPFPPAASNFQHFLKLFRTSSINICWSFFVDSSLRQRRGEASFGEEFG
jgi:hypothetical protein